MIGLKFRIAAALVALAGAFPAVALAKSLDPRLLGAWVSNNSDCKDVFVTKGGHTVYKAPVDQFVRAFLITPGQIVAPSGACRISSVSRDGDVSTAKAACHNTVGFANLTAKFTVKSDTEMQEEPDQNDMLTATYTKCK